ncbi:MAG: molybdopterin biosynthesis protein [Thaumarchaeota archaeon]|nr:molybdopterin biosynthesis protein [Nitrososphaerota archaeon]
MRKIFHRLVDPDEAVKLIAGRVSPIGVEKVPLLDALERILAEDIYARIDHPPFDRSLVDGYAVRAEDVYEADEENPVELKLVDVIEIGEKPETSIGRGECAEISTGAPIPPGADAVVMVEYTSRSGDRVKIFKAVKPGENIAQTGSDITAGDLLIRRGRRLTVREIAVLAATGYWEVKVYKAPKAAVFSIGGEIAPPGQSLNLGQVYDVNGYSITLLLRELGIRADYLGILPDDEKTIMEKLSEASRTYDLLVTSGGTSAGVSDLVYRAFEKLGEILVHGIRVKPGKPTILGFTHDGKLMIGLPGFPLSSIMAFTVVVKPILQKLLGLEEPREHLIEARTPFRINVGGRTHLIPVQLVETPEGLKAFPRLGDSGSVLAFLEADGFTSVPGEKLYLDEGEPVKVRLFEEFKPASVTIIGSHCPAINLLLDVAGIRDAKVVNVGSLGGWLALKRGEADVTGTHLLDEKTMTYNLHMPRKLGIEDEVEIYGGYIREIGFVTTPGNPKNIKSFRDLLRPDVTFVNRIKGSGIRTFIDLQLRKIGVENPEKEIKGYSYQAKTHTAVAAAVAQGRADVGVAVGYVAEIYRLEFIPLAEEHYDLAIRKDRLYKESMKRLLKALESREFSERLNAIPHYRTHGLTGRRIYP